MLRGALVGDIHQPPRGVPEIVVQRVVHHHPDEAAHHDRGIHLDQRTVALALKQVTTKEFINAPHELVENISASSCFSSAECNSSR